MRRRGWAPRVGPACIAGPVHEMPAFRGLAPAEGLPVTERLARTVLSLPMHPWLAQSEIDTIAARLREVV